MRLVDFFVSRDLNPKRGFAVKKRPLWGVFRRMRAVRQHKRSSLRSRRVPSLRPKKRAFMALFFLVGVTGFQRKPSAAAGLSVRFAHSTRKWGLGAPLSHYSPLAIFSLVHIVVSSKELAVSFCFTGT